MNIMESFNAHAKEYDLWRRQFIPCFDDFYTIATMVMLRHCGPRPRVLDLGAGTGLLSHFVLQAMPEAHLTLVDIADQMLDQARARFADRPDQVTIIHADYLHDALPGPFDAICSALSIHHLEAPQKRQLFRRCSELLGPGGVFVNADQILGPTPELAKWYDQVWEEAIRKAGVDDLAMSQARQRMLHDRLDTLEDQMRWLGEAGLGQVGCQYKWFALAVFSAVKPR